MNNDVDYWVNLTWPACPNEDDYKVFETHIKGETLLLGSTKLLLPLCSEAWDLNPKYENKKIKNKDWLDIDRRWDSIILDGGLSLSKELTDRLLPVIIEHCDIFISRSFLNPSWEPKYATYFPRKQDLTPQPQEIIINKVYSFYIWKNNKQF